MKDRSQGSRAPCRESHPQVPLRARGKGDLDTERLILFGQSAQGKDATETQMILNHKAAIEFLVDQAQELSFNRYKVWLNSRLFLSHDHDLVGDGLH